MCMCNSNVKNNTEKFWNTTHIHKPSVSIQSVFCASSSNYFIPNGIGGHPVSYLMDTRGPFPGVVKWLGREADCLPHSVVRLRMRRVISPLHMYLHLEQKDNLSSFLPLLQKCTIPGYYIPWGTKFCMMASNIYGSWVQNLLHVTILAPRIFRWHPDFWKICAPFVDAIY